MVNTFSLCNFHRLYELRAIRKNPAIGSFLFVALLMSQEEKFFRLIGINHASFICINKVTEYFVCDTHDDEEHIIL